MRWIFFGIVIVVSLVLSFSAFVPFLFPEVIVQSSEPNQLIFSRAMANIKKINMYIQRCKEGEDDVKGGEAESRGKGESSDELQKRLKELELILAYQNYLIAKNNYITIKERSLRKEISSGEVNSSYREYESARLYLERMLEQFPAGVDIIGHFPK